MAGIMWRWTAESEDWPEKKQLTRERLAEAADILLSFMGHIERRARKLGIQTIVLIDDAIGYSVDETFGKTGNGNRTYEWRS